MGKRVPFNKEKFLKGCSCGCTKAYQEGLLDKIEQYRQSEPEMIKYLEWYRDRLWDDQVKSETFREEYHKIGEEAMRKKTIAALRAVADLLESTSGCDPGIYSCELPEEPIAKSLPKNIVDEIKVTLSYPWGG